MRLIAQTYGLNSSIRWLVIDVKCMMQLTSDHHNIYEGLVLYCKCFGEPVVTMLEDRS